MTLRSYKKSKQKKIRLTWRRPPPQTCRRPPPPHPPPPPASPPLQQQQQQGALLAFLQTPTGFFYVRPRAGGYDLPVSLHPPSRCDCAWAPRCGARHEALNEGFLSAVGGFTRWGAVPDTGGLFSLGSHRLGIIEAFTGDPELLCANGV